MSLLSHITTLPKKISSALQNSRHRGFSLWRDSKETGYDQLARKNPEAAFMLDDQTSKDLELDTFYAQYNSCQTAFGDQYFWYRLHSQPEKDSSNFSKSDKSTPDKAYIDMVRYISANDSVRIRLEKLLKTVGKQFTGNIVHDIWEGFSYTPRFRKLIPYWVFAAPAVVTLGFILFGVYGVVFLLATALINLGIFIIANRKINYLAGSLGYLHRGLRCLLRTMKDPKLTHVRPEWKVDGMLKRIMRRGYLFKSGVGGPQSQDPLTMLLDYLRIFLCAELFAFYLTSNQVNAKLEDIRRLIIWLGKLDCAVQIANLVASGSADQGKTICFANTADAGQVDANQNTSIHFTNLYNPLVENCVGQDLSIKQGMVVTGMNMAGKSTFLKTVALNQLLAVSFGIAFAEAFQTRHLFIVSSLKVDDDIINKKSKYFVEAERLLMMQQLIQKKRLLCVVDEILNGTNTDDRITASLGILRSLAQHSGSLVIAATHDTVIAEKSSYAYDAYYFDGEIKDEKIVFDYTIKPGIVPKRNALALLHFMGLNIDAGEEALEKS